MLEWLENFASCYRYTIQLVAATAMAGTLIYTLYITYRDKGTLKARVFVRELRKNENINPIILGQYHFTISLLMKNTTNHSIYLSKNSFEWGLPRFFGALFIRPKGTFSGFENTIIPSHAEERIDLTYDFAQHRRYLKHACTVDDVLHLPTCLSILKGKHLPYLARRLVKLYIYAEDGMVYKAKFSASYKKRFFSKKSIGNLLHATYNKSI
ncbi:MAG: hypothetical protein IPK86_02540 [Neisseriales bacterium]|nr:MAG: hypothetical protein IPK86_02540 [Neisseriales bacterium]